MKIVHVITGLQDGGAEAVLYRVCMNARNNEHCVVSLMDEGKYGSLLRDAGVEVLTLGLSRGRLSLKALWRLWRFLRMKKADVVQTWMYHADFVGGLIARFAGNKAVVWGIRNSVLEPGKSARTTIWVAKACAVLSHWIPARIVVCAEAAWNVHAEMGYKTDIMRFVPNGYDVSSFAPNEEAHAKLRKEWGGGSKVPLLGMVARFDFQKDHHNLLQALGYLEQQGEAFRCVFVGTGMSTENKLLMDLIERFGVRERTVLLGRRTDIAAVMNALDVHVLSSSAEAFPNVVAEAMACGTPCVTTDVGDAAVIVGGTGWVVPPRSPENLAAALCAALTEWRMSKNSWCERQDAARQRIVDNFSLDRMIADYESVWRDAAEF